MITAKSAHEVLIGIIALLAFILIASTIAGISPGAGDAILALFVAFIVLQLLFKANIFQSFLSAHPIVANGQQSGTVTPSIPVYTA